MKGGLKKKVKKNAPIKIKVSNKSQSTIIKKIQSKDRPKNIKDSNNQNEPLEETNISLDIKNINKLAQENIQLWITHFQHNSSQLSSDLKGFIDRFATECKERDKKYFMNHHDSVLKLLMSSLVNEMTGILDQLLSTSSSQQKKLRTFFNNKITEKNARINELEYYVKRMVQKCDNYRLKIGTMEKRLKRGNREYKKLKNKHEKLSEKAMRLLNMELDTKSAVEQPVVREPLSIIPSPDYYNNASPISDMVTMEQIKFKKYKSMVQADELRQSLLVTQKSLDDELNKKDDELNTKSLSSFSKVEPPLFNISPKHEPIERKLDFNDGAITPLTDLSEASEILQHQGMSKEEWEDYIRIQRDYSEMMASNEQVRSYTPKHVPKPEFDDDVNSESSIVEGDEKDTRTKLQVSVEIPTSPVQYTPDSITPDSATDTPIFHSTPQMTERTEEVGSVQTPSMDNSMFNTLAATFERLSSANLPPMTDSQSFAKPFPQPPPDKDFKASLKAYERDIRKTEALLHYNE
mmetsp:Transcript_10303/g.15064  ORF Transcript_10303/g.15064 Transcript_10303/m.15064 type:complete len:520 (-) Transcript_10303:20-1579(-)